MAEKKKRLIQNIVIIILSLLLVTSVGLGATFAWFSDSRMSTSSITMAGGIRVSVLEIQEDAVTTAKVLLETPSDKKILPGMDITFTAKAQIKKTNTPALLRASYNMYFTGLSDDVTNEELEDIYSAINTQIVSYFSTNNGNDKWRMYQNKLYYLGMNTANSTLQNSVMEGINCSANDTTIALFDEMIIDLSYGELGSILDNRFRNSTFYMGINFQAFQGIIYDNDANLLTNTIANVIPYFDNAFDGE